jgi:hypothetical protein
MAKRKNCDLVFSSSLIPSFFRLQIYRESLIVLLFLFAVVPCFSPFVGLQVGGGEAGVWWEFYFGRQKKNFSSFTGRRK